MTSKLHFLGLAALTLVLCSCSSDTEEFEGDEPGECNDEADNDRDGLFDCDDDGCAGSPSCGGGDGDADADADGDVERNFRLEADPVEISANGTSTSTIDLHAEGLDGSTVVIETDHGYFVAEDDTTVQRLVSVILDGTATTELHATTIPGTATISARTESGEEAFTSVEIVAARPSGTHLSFACDVVNIGALNQPVPDYAIPCRPVLQDRDGEAIAPQWLVPADFGFLTEAGQIQTDVRDDGEVEPYFLYTARGGLTAPVDVAPVEGEPSRPGETGSTRNPRDGLVTLVVWVRGEEGFNDINSNGVFEPEVGETFTDLGEPFVDVNDDGAFDAGSGDTYLDADSDGRYSGPNGTWDEDGIIWTTFKLLWTGTAHESSTTSRIELQGGDRDIPSGATRMVTAALLDQNMNPVAALSEDTLTLYPGCSSCSYPSLYTFSIGNTRGFEVDAAGQIVGSLFEAPRFTLNLTNTNTYEEPETFSITVTAWATPAPLLSDGTAPTRVEYSLTALEARLLGQRSE